MSCPLGPSGWTFPELPRNRPPDAHLKAAGIAQSTLIPLLIIPNGAASFFRLPALSVARTQAGGAPFSRLRAVVAAENSKLLDQLVAENFDASSSEFIDALCECLPELSRDEVLWRFHFMLGTIYYSPSGPHRIKALSGGGVTPRAFRENVKHLIPFLAAGFRASVGQTQTHHPTASGSPRRL
jgi:hypothetical protein